MMNLMMFKTMSLTIKMMINNNNRMNRNKQRISIVMTITHDKEGMSIYKL
jgi:hypothetical protein